MAAPKTKSEIAEFPAEAFGYVPIGSIRENPRNARTHSKKQIREIGRSIDAFGFVCPVALDENDIVLAGHGRLAAAKQLGMTHVPTVRIKHLNDAQKRAYVLADNKLAEKAGWDRAMLEIELGALAVLLPEVDLDITVTGFEVGEIDLIFADLAKKPPPIRDEVEETVPKPRKTTTTRRGEFYRLGSHLVGCGDALNPMDIDRLMHGDRARMAFLDPPYNVRIKGHVQGRGAIQHQEFAFASGEMDSAEFEAFLCAALTQAARVSVDGALHYVCMDWRHIGELLHAGKPCYSEVKNVCVWDKRNPGQGSLYRSQHEFVVVYKVGEEPHRNGVELGRHGRSRSNVWTYPGASGFKTGGREELTWHPTVKPVALVADAMRDCTVRGEIVLDTFLGSGTTLIAAERAGRRCRGIEYEPKYVDVAIRRWQSLTKLEAVCVDTGKTFDELAAERAGASATEVIAAVSTGTDCSSATGLA